MYLIFIPSVNGSLILSDIINLPRQVNFLKWRASVAGVGSGGTSPFQTSNPYLSSQLYTGGGLYNPTTLSNENLKPLFTLSYETGIEAKFFKERVGLDFTLYHSNTRDQILTTILDRSSGYSNMVVNAGEVRNRGIEAALNLTPIKKRGGLTWTVNTTFSKNENKILSLAENTESLILQNGPGSNGYVMAYVGGSMGDLYGRGYKRAPSGEIIYNAGLPVLSEELLYLGNTTPDWKAGIQNKFKYKGFSLGFLFDAQVGAVAYSLTQGKMAVQGKTKVTLPGRENGIVGRGVVENEDGTYSPNTVAVYDMSSYYDQHFGVANVEGSVFSTDFIKLREVRFDYSFKAKVLQKVKLQKLNIGVYGRDLFIWSKWPGFDPEFGTLSGSEINRGFEIGQFPSTRTYGVNLSVGF
ncbi:TonB-dependent receptor domain-containing protein [Sphingobacterium sp. T2]|uniref:TonB-dependent receptor domain-containing protein n=1 Tax=Sphingobacterium sp. T2 TaxID=1590596 RepID=UPI000AA4F951|nr:TonB-dependent receptor [Sphingobacterium sp. T2]